MMNEQNEEQSKIGVDNMSEDVQHPLENQNMGSIEEEYNSRRISIARIIIWFVSCIPIVIGAYVCSFGISEIRDLEFYCIWGLSFAVILLLEIIVRNANTLIILVLSVLSYFFVLFSPFVGIEGGYILVIYPLAVFLTGYWGITKTEAYKNVHFKRSFCTKTIKLVIISTIAVELLSMTIVDGFPNLEMSVGLLVVAVSTLFASTPKRLRTVAIVWYILPLIFSCWQIIDYHRWEAISQWNPLLWPINTILPILCRIATFNTNTTKYE
ncbi:MAG: hypothetical protein IK053_07920 [Muribaculaceae bacterium]|nr:hypothetical protein [Muribaculaceae bacterium]